MAEIGIFIVEELIKSIGTAAVKEVMDMWGYKSQLEELNRTVTTIRKVLLDAEAAKRQLSNEQQDYINNLKEAVYEADDLFDELLTLNELKQLRPQSKTGKFYEKVRRFFSSNNQLGQARRMSHDVKDVIKKLGNIADTHKKFELGVDYTPLITTRVETCSFVDVDRLIGRDNDKEAIIDVLLNHNDDELFVVTIVGAGGLGKTTLAQFVYNDDRIKEEFRDLMLWVCVADQDGVPFDVKTILCKILEAADRQKFDSSCTMEVVRHKVEERLRNKKYLIVLDDVWNEDRKKWLELEVFLKLGHVGSKVVVTTRSESTGTAAGEKHKLSLQVLSPENSWLLFEMFAFRKDKPKNYHDFVETGKKIVAKCCNNPLAIKVLGSLLYGQGISKWRLLEESELAKIEYGDNNILSILKLSYYNLTPSLKNCFSYCALFHKDELIKKRRLIDLWIAQGYIIPSDENQDIEDVAEEHFLILLRRCFFQGVEDQFGNLVCVKIHDLIYDVALAGSEEIGVRASSSTMNWGKTFRHVRCDIDKAEVFKFPLGSSKLRSLIFLRSSSAWFPLSVKEFVLNGRQIESWMRLRVLGLSDFRVKMPESIGKLLHLRYLDLSFKGYLEVLPDAITGLHNLQTLLLRSCHKLRELPEDFCKLVNLRHLDLNGCSALTSMPWGMEKLTSLRVLPYYVVGNTETNNKRAVTGADNGLKALKSLTRIREEMTIEIREGCLEGMSSSEKEGLGAEYLKSLKHLTDVTIIFKGRSCYSNPEVVVLENLEPPSNVKVLCIDGYEGTRILKWGKGVSDNSAFFHSRLVSIRLWRCVNLEEVPVLSKLPLLKSLTLMSLEKLEYMETGMTSSEDALFFPSLVDLYISRLPKLKGWWKEKSCRVVDDHLMHSYCSYNRCMLRFNCLSVLEIKDCPNLTSFPSCPTIGQLWLRKVSSEMRLQLNQSDDNTVESSEGNNGRKLRCLRTDNIFHLKSLPIQRIISLIVKSNDKVEGQSQEELDVCYFPPNLLTLTLEGLKEMKSLPAGMQCLTSLQTLEMFSNKKLEALPEWISCFSSLNSFTIDGSPALKSLPQSMSKLTSLKRFEMSGSPEIAERCRKPDGEDYPKIKHIPHVDIVAN